MRESVFVNVACGYHTRGLLVVSFYYRERYGKQACLLAYGTARRRGVGNEVYMFGVLVETVVVFECV